MRDTESSKVSLDISLSSITFSIKGTTESLFTFTSEGDALGSYIDAFASFLCIERNSRDRLRVPLLSLSEYSYLDITFFFLTALADVGIVSELYLIG